MDYRTVQNIKRLRDTTIAYSRELPEADRPVYLSALMTVLPSWLSEVYPKKKPNDGNDIFLMPPVKVIVTNLNIILPMFAHDQEKSEQILRAVYISAKDIESLLPPQSRSLFHHHKTNMYDFITRSSKFMNMVDKIGLTQYNQS